MHSRQGLGQPFIVTRQPTTTCHPAERAVNDPAAWQQNEPFVRLGQLDDFQLDALRCGGLGGILARIALVNERYLDRLARYALHLFGQRTDVGAFLSVGGRDVQGQQVAQRMTAICVLLPFLCLAPS